MAKKEERGKGRRGGIKKIDGRHFSSGGVVFKKEKAKTLWLVTKSSVSKDFPEAVWRLPKGMLDDEGKGFAPGPMARGEIKATEEVIRETALREVEEEGGVVAEIVSKIETVKYFITVAGKRYMKFVTFYLMERQRDLPEGFGHETSEITWLPFEKAREKITYDGERRVLDSAKEVLEKEQRKQN